MDISVHRNPVGELVMGSFVRGLEVYEGELWNRSTSLWELYEGNLEEAPSMEILKNM